MSAVDTRHISRDSLFLAAEVRLGGVDNGHRVKVRNLSPGGMMADGEAPVVRGSMITVDLRNIGRVDGTVAWVQGNRFGIAFNKEIDSKRARAPGSTAQTPEAIYRRSSVLDPNDPANAERLRKI